MTPPRLKVWGLVIFRNGHWLAVQGQVRGFVAAGTQKLAAKLLGVTVGHLAKYGSESGNALELETALRRPGKVHLRHIDFGDQIVEDHAAVDFSKKV